MLDQFKYQGYIIVENAFEFDDIRSLQSAIAAVIRLVARIPGVPCSQDDSEALREGILELAKTDRHYVAQVYDAVKLLPEFQRFTCNQVFTQLFEKLRPDSMPGFSMGGSGIRIDLPQEESFRAHWHQEYLSQLRSIDGLTFWSPLVDIELDMGPVRVLPGSHKEGLLKTHYAEGSTEEAYALRLVRQEHLLRKYSIEQPIVNLGDLLVIDYLTAHSSGINNSTKPRWSLQTRYFNYLDTVGQSYQWRGSYANGVDFRRVHPECFVGGSDEM